MIERCYSPNDISYHNYGAKGIKVCERWLGASGMINFLNDMGLKPTKDHSIDRYPDTKGDYGPENCRWATKKTQNNNRNNNVYYEHNGERMTQAAWSERLGVNNTLIIWHLARGRSFSEVVDFLSNRGRTYKIAKPYKKKSRKLTKIKNHETRFGPHSRSS